MTDRRSQLPSVSRLLTLAESEGLLDDHPRTLVRDVLRELLSEARSGGAVPADWMAAVRERAADWRRISFRRVINATGVILHTNLGRAPLPRAARDAVDLVLGYGALEVDLESGERSSRQAHLRDLLARITGAEDSLVLNNAAAALLVTLNTLSEGGETAISRGELIEIGGSFRLPDIIRRSGTRLHEIGTTNRTGREDYERAVDAGVSCLLKVHRSNFVLAGYTGEASIQEVAALGRERRLPVVHDVGSGLLLDLSGHGLSGEPLVRKSAEEGAVTIFSGDKLLGGPQAGIIVGPASFVDRVKRNPLARAVRADKVTIAALEATLTLYLDRDTALREIPVLRMLTADPGDLKRRARRLRRRLKPAGLEQGESVVGGGSFPHAVLPTTLVTLETRDVDGLLRALRTGSPAIMARAAEDRVLLDPRTLEDAELAEIERAVKHWRSAN